MYNVSLNCRSGKRSIVGLLQEKRFYRLCRCDFDWACNKGVISEMRKKKIYISVVRSEHDYRTDL